MYQISQPPEDTPLARWMLFELRKIAEEFERDKQRIRLTSLTAEPTRIYGDEVVRADGTHWDPGSGAGLYAQVAGVWIQL